MSCKPHALSFARSTCYLGQCCSGALQEVAVCFGARLMRGNRVQKVHSSAYRAFDSLTYPPLATLGVDVDWGNRYLLQVSRWPSGRLG